MKRRKALQWLLLLLCMGFIVHFFCTNQKVLSVLLEIRPAQLVALIVFHFVYLALHGYRYKLVLEKCSERLIGFRPWFRLYILGRFANVVIPQAGNVYRSVRLKEDYGVTYTRYISAFFSLAWMSTCFNLLVALSVVRLVNPSLRVGPLPATQLLLGLAVLFAGIPILLEVLFRIVTVHTPYLAWLHAKLGEVLRVSVRNLREGGYTAGVFLVGFVMSAQACVIFYLCFHAIGIRVGPAEVVLFYVLLQLTTYLALTPGNLGVQEIVFGILGEQLQIGMGEGMLVSVLLRVLGYIALFALALPMGGLGLVRQAKRYRMRDRTTPDVEFERGGGLE